MNTAPSFNFGNGWLTTDFGDLEAATGLAIQPDGRIVVGGNARTSDFLYGTFGLARYNPDGSLDTSFGDGGRVNAMLTESGLHARDLVMQADGKILVSGSSGGGGFDIADIALARYNADGSVDTTFGGDGLVLTIDQGEAISMVVHENGKITIVGGNTLARYTTNGDLDTTFGGTGVVTTGFFNSAGGASGMWGVALQEDGKVVAVGAGGGVGNPDWSDFALARFNPDGTPDETFGLDGYVLTDIGGMSNHAFAVAILSDGNIIVVGENTDTTTGNAETSLSVVRYHPDGSIDTVFAPVASRFDHSSSYDVVEQDDGRIVATAIGDGPGGTAVFLTVRWNVDGTLDSGFGGDGVATIDTVAGAGNAVALQSDDSIVVAGTPSGSIDFTLARYRPDGTPDADPPTYVENGAAVVLDPSVLVRDAELAALGSYDGASLRLVRRGALSSDDVFSATGDLGALVESGDLVYDGVLVGFVLQNSDGALALTFNGAATQARVNGVLQSIAYSNASDAPPPSIDIRWDFADETGRIGQRVTTVLIDAVNDAPTFAKGPHEVIAKDLPLQTVTGWASAIDAGGPGETGQAFDFIVTNDNPALFASAPAIDASGTLTYAVAAGASGTATVTVRLHDDGGTAQGGSDTSAPQTFRIAATSGITLSGGAEADRVTGGAAAETLYGMGGNDTLNGGADGDTLVGGAGADALNGGAGIDLARYDTAVTVDLALIKTPTGDAVGDTFVSIEGVIGSIAADSIWGDNSANDLRGGGGPDEIAGRSGADTIDGGENIDWLYGNSGDDTINGGSAGDNLIGGLGADHLDGDAGQDFVRYETPVTVDLATPSNSTGEAAGDTWVEIEGVIGSPGVDALYGNELANDLRGGGGADTIVGRGGNDLLQGDAGDDTLDGGLQADVLYGHDGNDILDGGDDADWFYGGNNNDTIHGGAGNDALFGGPGADHLNGGVAGKDLARYETAVTLDLEIAANSTGDAVGDTFQDVEGVIGSAAADTLRGDAAANDLRGAAGNDVISGRDGDDILQGNTGNDTLEGGNQNDWLYGHEDNDTLRGGDGNDTLIGAGGNDTQEGGNGNDVLYYDPADTSVHGDAGFDTLKIDGTGWFVNLPAIADTVFIDIEAVNLTGTGNNTMRLAAGDVLALSSTTNDLRVDGDVGDILQAVGVWTSGPPQIVGSVAYSTYTQGAARIIVDPEVTLTFI